MSRNNAKAAPAVVLVPGTGTAEQEMRAELERLKAENEALRAQKATSGAMSLKVSPKGAVSLYGMGRWPTTLYREQWEKLFAHQKQIMAFIEANAATLSVKGAAQ